MIIFFDIFIKEKLMPHFAAKEFIVVEVRPHIIFSKNNF